MCGCFRAGSLCAVFCFCGEDLGFSDWYPDGTFRETEVFLWQKKFTGQRFTRGCPRRTGTGRKATASPARGRSAKATSHSMATWSSWARSLTTGTAGSRWSARISGGWSRRSKKAASTASSSRTSAGLPATTSKQGNTRRGYSQSWASVSSPSMTVMIRCTGIRSRTPSSSRSRTFSMTRTARTFPSRYAAAWT